MSLCIDCKTLAAPQKKGLFNGKKGAFFPSPLPFCDDGIKKCNSPLPLSDDFQCFHSRIIRRLSFGDRYLFRAILPCPMMPAAKVLSLWSLHHLPAGRPAEIRFHIHSAFVVILWRGEKPPQRPCSALPKRHLRKLKRRKNFFFRPFGSGDYRWLCK